MIVPIYFEEYFLWKDKGHDALMDYFSATEKDLIYFGVFAGIKKITEGGDSTKFLYDGTDIIAEYDENGSLLRRYVYGGVMDEPLM